MTKPFTLKRGNGYRPVEPLREIFRMAKKRYGKRAFPIIELKDIRRLNGLIPFNRFESITARSDKLAIAYLQKMFGPDWIERHIEPKDAFLGTDRGTDQIIETRRMRRIMLMEMLHNLRFVKGFWSCVDKLAGGQVESMFAVFDAVRLVLTMAVDKGLSIYFIVESGVPKNIARRDYDLSIKFSDGVHVRAEAKCKSEETAPSLRTIERSLSDAKAQLPKSKPSMIFLKLPRPWIDDEQFTIEIRKLAQRFLFRSPDIVSVKLYTHVVVPQKNKYGESIAEVMAVREENSQYHRFRKYRQRDWNMFPTNFSAIAPPPYINYNGMPVTWDRLLVQRSDRFFYETRR